MFAQIFGDGRPLVLGADALGNRDADIVEEDLILFVLVTRPRLIGSDER
jgi:hypothetical protein